VDLVAEYAEPLSVGTLAEFTGLPREDGARWIQWQRRMFDVRNQDDGARATQEMNAYIEALIAERRRARRSDDFISLLMDSEVDGHRLTDREIHAFCQLQFGAGFETTADAMSITLHYLAMHPEVREQLAASPDLLPGAVEEFLRYATPIQIFGRNATRDLDLHGRQIKHGDVVALSFASANHDPEVFPDPDRCIVDRFQGTAPSRHLTFGSGVHLCLGAPVARLELAITLREFTTRVPPLRLAAQESADGSAGSKPANEAAGVTWKQRGDRRGLATLQVRTAG
jgi:cytochrome P450